MQLNWYHTFCNANALNLLPHWEIKFDLKHWHFVKVTKIPIQEEEQEIYRLVTDALRCVLNMIYSTGYVLSTQNAFTWKCSHMTLI